MKDHLAGLYDDAGIFLTRDAVASGLHQVTLTRLVRRGEIQRVRHGAYANATAWEAASDAVRHLLRARAAFRSALTPVAISHVSSLVSHTSGHWDLPLEEVDLTHLDGTSARRVAGVRQHHGWSIGVVEPWNGLLRTNAARAALEAATLLDFEHSLVVINSLLHEGATTKEQLRHQLVDMYQWPGTLGHELLLQECDGRIETVGETRTYCALRGSGLPRPIPQYEVRGAGGDVLARLDFALPQLRVWVEFDGMVKYEKLLRAGERSSDVVLRERNRERQVEAITGWVCVRVCWSDLARPAYIVEMIRQAAATAAARRLA